jgi:hypothetical protein
MKASDRRGCVAPAPEGRVEVARPCVLRHEPISCSNCPIGRVSGASQGQFCPFIIRDHDASDLVCLAGNPIDHVWFIKSGVVGLSRSQDADQLDELDALCMPGGFIGLECLFGDRYLRTARVMSRASLCSASREGFFLWLRQSDERVATIERIALDNPLLVDYAKHVASGLSEAPRGVRTS